MWPFKQNQNLTEYSWYVALKIYIYFFKIYLPVKTKSNILLFILSGGLKWASKSLNK